MKLGQYALAYIDGKECPLTNTLYQRWKAAPSTFIVDGTEYNKITKHSTTSPAKYRKSIWYTFADGSNIEVLAEEDWRPKREPVGVCWRSVKTWYEITQEATE